MLMRILLPSQYCSVLPICLLPNSCFRFVLYSISPLLYNLGIIFGIAVLYPRMGLSGLAWCRLGAFFC